MYENAQLLVNGLSSSKIRWEESVERMDKDFGLLDGNVLLSTTYFSYFGPFPSEYRADLKKKIMIPMVKDLKIDYHKKWNFISFQTTDMDIKTWKNRGLPSDAFSQENAILVMQGRRWPVCIDP